MNPRLGLSLAEAAERARLRKMAGTTGGGALNPLPVKKAAPVRAVPRQLDGRDPRPRAPSREACPWCNARGDLGCDHFAPCEPASLPRESRGLRVEKTSPAASRSFAPAAGTSARREPRRFTPDEDRRILELARRGERPAEIARRLDRRRGVVNRRLEVLRDG